MGMPFTSLQGIENLIYGVQFDRDPTEPANVERIFRVAVQMDELRTPEDYAALIREALNSEEQFSSLIPHLPHSEEVIRRFLEKMLDRINSMDQRKVMFTRLSD